jgi:hypothetical protein
VGFKQARLAAFTGFKSSPYTEGALFYGEKPAEAAGGNEDSKKASVVN